MAKALYHQDGKEPQTFTVLKETKTKDQTLVDLGRENEEGETVAVVTSCPVLKEPKHGHATLVADEDPEGGKKKAK